MDLKIRSLQQNNCDTKLLYCHQHINVNPLKCDFLNFFTIFVVIFRLLTTRISKRIWNEKEKQHTHATTYNRYVNINLLLSNFNILKVDDDDDEEKPNSEQLNGHLPARFGVYIKQLCSIGNVIVFSKMSGHIIQYSK